MDMWFVFLIPLLVLILLALAKAFSNSPGKELNRKFIRLGVLSGKSYNEIIAIVGDPNSTHTIGSERLCQWIQPSYNISLIFDKNNICLGVHSETKIEETY